MNGTSSGSDSANFALKLSEKGDEQRFERGFGRYMEHERGLWVV